MGHAAGTREVEIKLAVDSAAAGKRLLKKAGFRLSRRRVFEANTVFDNERQQLRKAGTLLRVREVNGRGVLTYKGPAAPGRHKSREEIETAADPAALRAILCRLGFQPVFRYEKYRAEYTGGAGAAMLDETPDRLFSGTGRRARVDRPRRPGDGLRGGRLHYRQLPAGCTSRIAAGAAFSPGTWFSRPQPNAAPEYNGVR